MSTFEDQYQNQFPEKLSFSQKIKDFWLKYGEKIILVAGIILIALISFEAGFLKGQKNQKEPIQVNQAACLSADVANAPHTKTETSKISSEQESKTSPSAPSLANGRAADISIDNQKCAYVASKNSNKYHLAACQFAQKIKPENRVCFSSAEEAESRGYQGAKCCIK